MKFRVLAIDGGGIRGVYPAYILRRIEQEFKISLADHFDLITGTSTGSIIAAAIATGYPVEKVVGLYEEKGLTIFRRRPHGFLGLFASRYSNKALKLLIDEAFGDTTLSTTKTRLLLPATDIANGAVHVFKSSYHKDFVRDNNVRIADAVLASCSAPTYFNPHKVGNYLLADGGLWANNPAVVGLTEALGRLEQKSEDVEILSIGTGIGNKYYPVNRKTWGLIGGWRGPQLINTILNLQSKSSDNIVGLVLQKGKYVRINFESDKPLKLDAPSTVAGLKAKADRDFTHSSAIIRDFLQ